MGVDADVHLGSHRVAHRFEMLNGSIDRGSLLQHAGRGLGHLKTHHSIALGHPASGLCGQIVRGGAAQMAIAAHAMPYEAAE